MNSPSPVPVVLRPVDADLVAATLHAVAAVAGRLTDAGVPGQTSALGSSQHLDSLTKGDVDVLVVATEFTTAVRSLDRAMVRAQPENWTAEFASFTAEVTLPSGDVTPVGVQVVAEGSALDAQMTSQVASLTMPALRRRYDVAKQHGAVLGPEGYWRVKDLFWRCLDLDGPTWSTQVGTPILKILTSPQLDELLDLGATFGAPIDASDGYVHFSTPEQVGETLAKHFAGQDGLWVLTLDADALKAQGDDLRWDPSRGGAFFPHLYGPLRLADVRLARPVPDH